MGRSWILTVTQKNKLPIPWKNTWRGGTFLLYLFFIACQSDPSHTSWDISVAKAEIEKLIHGGEKMMALGKEEKLEDMASMARSMKKITKDIERAIPPTLSEGKQAIRHLKVVLDEVESVIVHSRKGHQEDCLLHGQKALGRAKKAKEHIDKL